MGICFTPKGRPLVELAAEQRDPFPVKRDALLEYLRSSNSSSKNKYKRLSLSPIRYAGGKSLAVGHVLELLPDNLSRLVSPFFGGGSVEIALAQILQVEVVGYDIFDILVNYWQHQLDDAESLYWELSKMPPEKTFFEDVRKELNKVWKKELQLDPLDLASKYVYNFNLSYGPGFMGWSSDIYLKPASYQKMISYIRDFRAPKLTVEEGNFVETIPRHQNDFLYLDPPYLLGEDSRMFKGIYPMRNIPVHHNGFDHILLSELLKDHKGGFVLSYNNCAAVRSLYQGLDFSFPSWQYSMGQGETRIGFNRRNDDADHIKSSHEILIFKPPSI